MTAVRLLPLGYQQLTSISSAAPLSNIPPGMVVCTLQAEVENVRYRDDGEAPTASVGNLLVAGQEPFLYTGTVSALQFIAATAGAILNVSFYRVAG
jgi:hypothetical protein